MKPVNFVEVKKERKDFKKNFLFLIPLFVLILFIAYDIGTNYETSNKDQSYISLQEVNNLNDKINTLEIENHESELIMDFYKSLEERKHEEDELSKMLTLFLEETSENIFLSSFSYDKDILIVRGVSLSSDLLDNFDKLISKKTDRLVLNEVIFQNGYYEFSYKGELQWISLNH